MFQRNDALRPEFKSVGLKVEVIGVLMLAVFAVPLSAANDQSLGLDSYLILLEKQHPLFKQKQVKLASQRAYRDSLGAADDWHTYAQANVYQQENPVVGTGPEKVWGQSTELGIRRRVWATGGDLSVNWRLQNDTYEGNSALYINGDKYGVSQQVDLQYSHPLWGNSAGIADRENWDVANLQEDIVGIGERLAQEAFLFSSGSLFLQWQRWVDQRKLMERRVRLTQRLLRQVSLRRKSNLVDKVDVLRSEESLRSAQQSLALIKAAERELQTQLLQLIAEPNETMKPAFSLTRKWALPTRDEISQYLRNHDQQVRLYKKQIKQLQRKLETLDSRNKGDLRLGMGVAFKSHEDSVFDSVSLNHHDASVSLSYEMPLGNREVNLNRKRLRHELQLLSVIQQQYWVNTQARAFSLLSKIQLTEKAMGLSELQVLASQKTTQEEKRLYEQGRNDLSTVIQSQDNEQQARLRLVDNALDYQLLVLQLDSLLGRLVDRAKGRMGVLTLVDTANSLEEEKE